MDKYLKRAKQDEDIKKARFAKEIEKIKEKSIEKAENIKSWYEDNLEIPIDYNLEQFSEGKIVITFPFFYFEIVYLGKELFIQTFIKHYYSEGVEKTEEDCIIKINYEWEFSYLKEKINDIPEKYFYRGVYKEEDKNKIIEELKEIIDESNMENAQTQISNIVIDDIKIKIQRHLNQAYQNKQIYGITYNISSYKKEEIYDRVLKNIENGAENIKVALQQANQKSLF